MNHNYLAQRRLSDDPVLGYGTCFMAFQNKIIEIVTTIKKYWLGWTDDEIIQLIHTGCHDLWEESRKNFLGEDREVGDDPRSTR